MKLLLGFALLWATPSQPDALQTRIQQYWDLLLAGDKVAAMEFVLPEDRNAFIKRREDGLKDWTPRGIELQDEDTARVSVTMHRELPDLQGIHPTPLTETWERVEGVWFVRIRSAEETHVAAMDAIHRPPDRPLSGKVEILTKQARIHFVNARQYGSVVVFNGTQLTVQVSAVEVDQERFRVVKYPEEIASGERTRVTFEYIGGELEKNLTSQIRLTFAVPGESAVLAVPILYNYVSKGVQSLFGLTDEQVASLTREDLKKIKPVNAPKGAPTNPPQVPPKPPQG